MKSSVRAKIYETPCKECIFATYSENTQVGCAADRLKHFDVVEAYDHDKEFFVVKGACNYSRPKFWNKGDPSVEIAEIENMPSVCIIFDIYKDESQIPVIEKTVDLVSYPNNKVFWILVHSFNDHEKFRPFHSKLLEKGYKATIVSVNGVLEPHQRYAELSRRDHNASFTYYADPSKFQFLMNEVNDSINLKGEKLIFAEHPESEARYVMTTMMKRWGGGTLEQFLGQVKEDCKEKGYYKKI